MLGTNLNLRALGMAKLMQQELAFQPFCIRFSYLLIVISARGVRLSHLKPASPQCCAEALLAWVVGSQLWIFL